jgi:hypothetical protein
MKQQGAVQERSSEAIGADKQDRLCPCLEALKEDDDKKRERKKRTMMKKQDLSISWASGANWIGARCSVGLMTT